MSDPRPPASQMPFPPGANSWEAVCETPWFSMFWQGGWFAVGTTNGTDPASILVMDAKSQVLLLETYRPGLDRVMLETPRGGAEPGERPVDTARRELMEETGVFLRENEVVSLGHVNPDSGILMRPVHLFFAPLPHAFEDLDLKIDTDEVLGHVLMPFDDLRARVMAGEINDSQIITMVHRLTARGANLGAPLDTCHDGRMVQIEIVDPAGVAVARMTTLTPDRSFRQYCEKQGLTGHGWRFISTIPG